jgi:hypothetical protein
MPTIKTKPTATNTIKSLDRAANISDHMRVAYTKTKEHVEPVSEREHESAVSFAADQMSGAMKAGAERSTDAAVRATQKSYRAVSTKCMAADVKTRRSIFERNNAVRSEKRTSTAQSSLKVKNFADSRKIKTATYRGEAKKLTERNAQKHFEHTAKSTAKRTARETKRAVRNTAKAIKAAISGAKALVAAIASGGWIAIIVILVCCLFGAAFYYFGDESSKSYTPVSAEVEAYTPVIQQYAKQYGISEYVELIKAVMMQESGGGGKDPMQASECGYNKKYPRKPNGITDPEYSISCGVQQIRDSLKAAKCKNPLDMLCIRLALQGYNYGNGYIPWAIKRDGGYTVENAALFSEEQAAKHGWKSYGDKQYPTHVLRYYPYGSYNYGIGNTAITKVALAQLGNKGGRKFWSWYGFKSHTDWCAIYVSWCADQCGYIKSGTIPKFAYVQSGADWFKAKGQWQRRGYKPSPGDIIFFDWGTGGDADHVGIVEKCDGATIYTIEGNSGDQCRRRSYGVNSGYIYGFGVPKY